MTSGGVEDTQSSLDGYNKDGWLEW